MTHNLKPVCFRFDGGPIFEGFADGTTWNGFQNVSVRAAALADIIVWVVKDAGGDEASAADLRSLPADGQTGLISLGWGWRTTICSDEEALAYHFAKVLRRDLTAEQFAEMKKRNESPHQFHGACASHDFLDANRSMEEAFVAWRGRGADMENADDRRLWINAWDTARRLYLGRPLSVLDRAIREDDVDVALKMVMDALGIESGDVASQFFSSAKWPAGFAQRARALGDWLSAEATYCDTAVSMDARG